MTVRADGSNVVVEGDCPVEDAEVLVRVLQGDPAGIIDWTGAARLHTSVIQIVLLAGRRVRGPCGDPFVAQWIEPGLVARSAAEA